MKAASVIDDSQNRARVSAFEHLRDSQFVGCEIELLRAPPPRMSINYVYKVKKGIHKVIYDKLYFNCSTFRKMHYEVSKL